VPFALSTATASASPRQWPPGGAGVGSEHFVEWACELGVVVAQQEPDRRWPTGQLHRVVSCLLGDPGGIRIGRDASHGDAPGGQFDEEQHIQRLQQTVSTSNTPAPNELTRQ
jgi:hypothetical protein